MYMMKSTSEDGVYFLVNKWRKNKALWLKASDYRVNDICAFKRPQDAKTAMTKLLKVMPEYAMDKLELVEV